VKLATKSILLAVILIGPGEALAGCPLEFADYTTADDMSVGQPQLIMGDVEPLLRFSEAPDKPNGVVAQMTTARGKTVEIGFTFNNGVSRDWAVMVLEGTDEAITTHLITLNSDFTKGTFSAGRDAPFAILFPLATHKAWFAYRAMQDKSPPEEELALPHPGAWVFSKCRK
jgi:hypothetical protein